MNPFALVHLSPDTLREHARHDATARPVAARVERKWAAAACLAAVAVAALSALLTH
jgi:hypothetical protein